MGGHAQGTSGSQAAAPGACSHAAVVPVPGPRAHPISAPATQQLQRALLASSQVWVTGPTTRGALVECLPTGTRQQLSHLHLAVAPCAHPESAHAGRHRSTAAQGAVPTADEPAVPGAQPAATPPVQVRDTVQLAPLLGLLGSSDTPADGESLVLVPSSYVPLTGAAGGIRMPAGTDADEDDDSRPWPLRALDELLGRAPALLAMFGLPLLLVGIVWVLTQLG